MWDIFAAKATYNESNVWYQLIFIFSSHVNLYFSIVFRMFYLATGWLQTCASRTFGSSSRVGILAEHARVSRKIWSVINLLICFTCFVTSRHLFSFIFVWRIVSSPFMMRWPLGAYYCFGSSDCFCIKGTQLSESSNNMSILLFVDVFGSAYFLSNDSHIIYYHLIGTVTWLANEDCYLHLYPFLSYSKTKTKLNYKASYFWQQP